MSLEKVFNMFRHLRIYTLCLLLSVLVYFIISKVILDNIYITSNMIVDEEFHIPLGESYCKLDFSQWDPKVTTLPGLYLVSTFVLAPFNKCSTYYLRFVSLLASVVNIFLFYDLFSITEKGAWRNILSSLSLALLPPLYFFSHLYYTDVVSVMMTLAMLVLSKRSHHIFASVFGMFSVVCRQTNIIWVGLVAARYILVELYKLTTQKTDESTIPVKNFYQFIIDVMRKPKSVLLNASLEFWFNLSAYALVLLMFVVFVIVNGGIVVGDKSAHESTLHIPQLFYFSLFTLVFAWPHFVGEVLNFAGFAWHHKFLILCTVVLGVIVVHLNTLVHPYLLADNRHYFFYVWNRFYGSYALFRYFMVPIYVFAWYVIIKTVYDENDISFILLYLPCVFAVLFLQVLVDVRYYFIPFILFRLRIKNTANTVFNVILEFVTFCVVDAISLNLFFTKTIIWDDYDAPQRLIW